MARMYTIMWAKHTLGVPGVTDHAALKGQAVKAFETFQDEHGTWCYNIETMDGAPYHVACTHLRKTAPDGTPPPSDALEATGGIRAGRGNAQS